MRPLTAIALAAFATLSGCERQTPEEYHAERADHWRERITIVPYVDAGVTCFVLDAYSDSISCLREAAR